MDYRKSKLNNEFKAHIDCHQYSAFMFYKGTACPLCLCSAVAVHSLESNAVEMIKMGLRMNVGLKEQIRDYKMQMDIMEKRLVNRQRPYLISGTPLDDSLNEEEMYTWWLNMFALLKMKEIETNDMNGLLIIQ